MSRRPPNPAAERAAQNQQTIKSLLKLEPNKICADCKRNKHPRWASWNLGVFICIRCSGIHRGMGTHISRVKSVDLDSWTDEQLQSVLRWGNARANKYWEAKLADNHVPSEAKIENFIRTKYELKRWAMDGPIPDPATLDTDADDDVPLSIVKEKQNIERKVSVRKSTPGQSAAPARVPIAAPVADLIGGNDPLPQRSSSAGPSAPKVPPKGQPAPPKATSTKDSLLGLDFLGEQTATPPRPASTTGTNPMGGQSRPDLKQSILSLYATAPRPAAQQPQQPQHSGHVSQGSFGGFQSAPTQQPQTAGPGLTDAFSSLNFSTIPSPKSPPQTNAFANLGTPSGNRSASQRSNPVFSSLSGGSFFDAKPAVPVQQHQPRQSFGGSSGFPSFTNPTPSPPKPTAGPASSALGDLFDFSSPPVASKPPPASSALPQSMSSNSVFNLSSNQPELRPTPAAPAVTSNSAASGGWSASDADVWGGNAWGNAAAPAVAAAAPAAPLNSPAASNPVSSGFGGWGAASSGGSFSNTSIVPGAGGGFSTAPRVAADEEFGGWASSTGPPSAGGTKALGANEDLFSNVWQ